MQVTYSCGVRISWVSSSLRSVACYYTEQATAVILGSLGRQIFLNWTLNSTGVRHIASE